MNVKRYIVTDMSEAMIKIKNELGTDAVILNTRKIKQQGIFGFFKKSLIEVVAAIDEEYEGKKEKPLSDEELKKAFLEAKEKVTIDKKDNEFNKINSEIDSIKQMIEKLVKDKEINKEIEKVYRSNTRSDISSSNTDNVNDSMENKLINFLIEKNVSDENSRKLVDMILDSDDISNLDFKNVKKLLYSKLLELIGPAYTIENEDETQKVYVFVGPTGVGKTTTLAKLAARLSLIENRKVGLITADTYRIAAVEQLKTYSEILGIPLTVVYEAEELDHAIKKYSNMDCILIDTAGRSHKSEELEKDIKSLLINVAKPELFLVISLTTGYKDIKSIVDAYSFLDDYKLILTKLDEASSLGNILNVKMLTNKQLSYFTIGQSVPDDIEIAKASKVASFIVGDN
ncbi:MAG: flagellar biosynthesis protein FlhF [Acidaminobacteraceae bacterium]